jgi:hypothetical protein
MQTPRLSFPLTPFQVKLLETVERLSHPAVHCAKNAIWHLNRAQKLTIVDPEMAVFRSITAEEESASALFMSLKARKYAGARRLKPRAHKHKNALIPFFDAISELIGPALEASPFSQPTVYFDEEVSPPRLRLRLTLRLIDGEVYLFPEPPLHLSFSVDGAPADFTLQFQGIAARFNHDSVEKFLQVRAEQRNILLYAGNDGGRRFSGDIEALVAAYRTTVFRNLTLLCLIDLHSEPQGFVQQCLDAFLKNLGT